MFAETECIPDLLVSHTICNEAYYVLFARRKQSLSARTLNLKWFQTRDKFKEKF